MEQPITVKFRWTAEDLYQGSLDHRRQLWRPIFRVISNILVYSVLIVVAIGTYFAYRHKEYSAALGIGLFVVLLGLLWLCRFMIFHWTIQRRFRKRPDQNIEIEWEFAQDKILERSSLGNSELRWEGFVKVVRAPTGIMFYPLENMFHYLPRRGFANDAAFEQLVELTRKKVRDFRVVY